MTPAQVTEVSPYEQECLTRRIGQHARRSCALYLLTANSRALCDGVPLRDLRRKSRWMFSCWRVLRTGGAVRVVLARSKVDADSRILRGFYNVLIVRVRECAAAAGAGLPDLWRLCFAECGDRTFGRFRRPMAIEGVI